MSFCYHISTGKLSHKTSTGLVSHFLGHILLLHNLESKMLNAMHHLLQFNVLSMILCLLHIIYALFSLNMKRQKKNAHNLAIFKVHFYEGLKKSYLEKLRSKNHSIWLLFNVSKYINSLLKCRSSSSQMIFLFLGA